jgi:methyl-accepting chemotaxis protein
MTEISSTIGQIDEVAAAISAAVEQQSATTRELAASVQLVSGATGRTAQAMAHVVEVAGEAGRASGEVLEGVGVISREAEKLRGEVEQFLVAVRSETGDRRRISGKGMTATVRALGREAKVILRDLSHRGAALNCDWSLPAGTSVEVELPNASGKLMGRVTRADGRELALAFSTDAASAARIDRAMDELASIAGIA